MWGGDYVSLKLDEYGFGENGKVSVDDFWKWLLKNP